MGYTYKDLTGKPAIELHIKNLEQELEDTIDEYDTMEGVEEEIQELSEMTQHDIRQHCLSLKQLLKDLK